MQNLLLNSKTCTTNILSKFDYKKKEEIIDEENSTTCTSPWTRILLEVINQVTSKKMLDKVPADGAGVKLGDGVDEHFSF